MSGASHRRPDDQPDYELTLDVRRLTEPAFVVNSARRVVAWNRAAERLLGVREEEALGLLCYEALALCGGVARGCHAHCMERDVVSRAASLTGAPLGEQISEAAPKPTPLPAAPDGPEVIFTARDQRPCRVGMTTFLGASSGRQKRIVHLLHERSMAPLTPPAHDPAAPAADAPQPAPLLPSAPHAALHALPLSEPGGRTPTASVAVTESGSRQRRPLALTQRELEVLRLLGAGHSTDEIARELSITRVTARNHVNKLLDKLGVNSRLQAVVVASQLRLI